MDSDNLQIVSMIILVPIVLSVMMILEGMKSIIQAKQSPLAEKTRQLDDESLISGRSNGCFGLLYIILGIMFLILIGYVYVFLTR